MNHDLPVNDCQDRTDRCCGNGRRGDVSSQNSCQYLSFPPGILLTLHKLLRHCVVLCESFTLCDAHYTCKRIGPICTNLRIRLHVSNVGHCYTRDYRVNDRHSDVQPDRVGSPDMVGTLLAECKRRSDKHSKTNDTNERKRNASAGWLKRGRLMMRLGSGYAGDDIGLIADLIFTQSTLEH